MTFEENKWFYQSFFPFCKYKYNKIVIKTAFEIK